MQGPPGFVGPTIAALDLWGSVLLPVCRLLTCWAVLPIGATTIRIVRPACCHRRRLRPSSLLALHGCVSHTCAGDPACEHWQYKLSHAAVSCRLSDLCSLLGLHNLQQPNLRRHVNLCPCLHHMGRWMRRHRRQPERLRWPASSQSGSPLTEAVVGLQSTGGLPHPCGLQPLRPGSHPARLCRSWRREAMLHLWLTQGGCMHVADLGQLSCTCAQQAGSPQAVAATRWHPLPCQAAAVLQLWCAPGRAWLLACQNACTEFKVACT